MLFMQEGPSATHRLGYRNYVKKNIVVCDYEDYDEEKRMAPIVTMGCLRYPIELAARFNPHKEDTAVV